MTRFRHKKWGLAFKGITVLLYVALFITQASDKFYLYAGAHVQVINTVDKEATHLKPSVSQTGSNIGYNRRAAFSLDKRYNLTNVFTIIYHEFCFETWYAGCEKVFNARNQTIISSSHFTISLRGPPSAATV